MIINLLDIWKEHLLKKQQSLLPENPANFSDQMMQSSFDLPKGVKVIFTNDQRTLTPVIHYESLSEVMLTAQEKSVVKEMSDEILKRNPPNNYDGDHLLISAVLYDTEKNTLFIEAKKAKYSLLVSLTANKFPKYSPILQQDLYGAGAFVPLITGKDGYTVLLQSSKYDRNNFLTAGGFVQAKDDTTMLAYPDGSSLVEKTAIEELQEELLSDKRLNPRIEMFGATNVSSISFRKPLNGRGFVEFVVPITLNCTHEQLAHVIRTNQAPDRGEHTGVFQLINLNPDERFNDYATWSKDKPGGRDLYPSIVREASRCFNAPKFGNATQRHMPNYRGEALPVSLFNPTISVYQHSLLSGKLYHARS